MAIIVSVVFAVASVVFAAIAYSYREFSKELEQDCDRWRSNYEAKSNANKSLNGQLEMSRLKSRKLNQQRESAEAALAIIHATVLAHKEPPLKEESC